MALQQSWKGSPRIKGFGTSHRMAMLTFALIGLQFTWGVEMTYFTPYLLKLGLAKSQTSLVWIAPPLSGLIVQPVIGTISDSAKFRWGRRRPLMLAAALLVGVFMLTLGWAAEIVGILFSGKTAKELTACLAIFCIYAVDFAINAVQATSRSLIVDTLPVSQQQLGSAWAGRMLGFGHVLGYLAGTLDILKYFGKALGADQFKAMCLIASATMLFCVCVTCFSVEERILVSEEKEERMGGSEALKMITTIVKTTLHLPRKIRAVCWITFWSWIGWSPFFVYGATWAGETYYRQSSEAQKELQNSTDVVGDIARKGSLALVLFSFISFAGSVMLPWVVESPDSEDDPLTPAKEVPEAVGWAMNLVRRYRLDITTAWGISQLGFATSMILAPFSSSFQFATTLIALCGLPWAMYGWAPLALMGEEINKLETSTSSLSPAPYHTHHTHDRTHGARPLYTRINSSNSIELNRNASYDAIETTEFAATNPHNVGGEGMSSGSGGTAGVYLGIWNIFATIPQFIATFISMIVFSILEPGLSPELGDSPKGNLAGGGGNSTAAPGGGGSGSGNGEFVKPGLSGTAVLLAIGAVCSFVAAGQSFRLRKL